MLGGEHENRSPISCLADTATNLEAIDFWQENVEKNHVVGIGECLIKPDRSVASNVDMEPLGLKTSL